MQLFVRIIFGFSFPAAFIVSMNQIFILFHLPTGAGQIEEHVLEAGCLILLCNSLSLLLRTSGWRA
jgi:hypothetical protein